MPICEHTLVMVARWLEYVGDSEGPMTRKASYLAKKLLSKHSILAILVTICV